MTTVPAGWYADGHGATRYWDGSHWTTHVLPSEGPSNELVSRPTPGPVAQRPPQEPIVVAHPLDPGYSAQGYTGGPAYRPVAPAGNSAATAGFVCGLISFLLTPILLIPILGWLIYGTLSLLGIILSIVGLTRAGALGTGTGLAVAGLILAIL